MSNYLIYKLESVSIPEYHVSISPQHSARFEEQLNDVVRQFKSVLASKELEKKHLVFAKIFVSDYINLKPLMDKHGSFTSVFTNCVVSVVEQAPLDGTKINLLLYFLKTDELKIGKDDDSYLLEIGNRLHLYQSVTEFESQTPYSQTEEAFRRHIRLLEKHGLNLKDNCLRTWIYSRDVDKDYPQIVVARNDVFETEELTRGTHYIASTGIGGKGLHPSATVNIDFYSVAGISPEQIHYLQALDYLNPTHEYGVAFERGTSISYPDKKHLFISGTASIDKDGDCIFRNDVLKQAERLFLNIAKLLEDGDATLADIAQMIVYLRNASDYNCIKIYLDQHFPDTPKVVVLARVCRPEWLIEVECFCSKRS